MVDTWVHWLWHFQKGGEEPDYFVHKINDTGIKIYKHFLPHDAYQERAGGSWHTLLKRAGLRNCSRLPKTNDRWVGIRALQGILKRSKFNLKTTSSGMDFLMEYRSEIDIKHGIMKSIPVHDRSSDTADAARYLAEAVIEGKVKDKSPMEVSSMNRAEFSRRLEMQEYKGFKSKNWWQ